MDEMKIKTNFMKGLISMIVEKNIKKKLGNDITFFLDDLEFKNDGEHTNLKIGVELNVKTKDIFSILSELKVV